MRTLTDIRARFVEQPRDRSRVVLSLIVVTYVVRVIASVWRTDFTQFFPDSASYVSVSRIGPFHPSFWFSDRPVGVPLVLWLVGGNHRAFFLVQTLFFALSLAYLCSVVLRVITPRWLAWIGVAVSTSLAFQPRFGIWHLEILSESLALSLSMSIIAVWLRFASEPSRRHLVLGVVVTIAWMSVRDVHIVVGSVVALALLTRSLAGRSWPLRKAALVGTAVLLAFVGYVLVAQSASDRNVYPLINNVGKRVLSDAEVTGTFVDFGMPLDDALLERTGSDSWSDDQQFLVSEDLAHFRSWADDKGQRALVSSLLVDASFWTQTTHRALDSALSLDFTEYDRYSTSDRLPTRLLWIHGPRTLDQLVVWSGVGLTLLGVLFATSGRRRFAAIGSIAVVATLADIYVSASGDSVEVQRHLLGPIFRLTLIFVLLSVLGVQAILHRVRRVRDRTEDQLKSRDPVSVSGSLAVSLAAIGLFGAWVGLERRSQDYDPQYARTIIERAARFGGSYYENGIHNKGPLETAVYDSARIFTSFDTYWFAISAYIVAISILLGSTAWRIVRNLSPRSSPVFATAAAALVTSHFVLSDSDYAGVLYSRNITTAILAVVVGATLWERPWSKPKRATVSYVVLFALLGLAIQTLLTTVFAAIVIGVFVYVRRSSSSGLRHRFITAALTMCLSVASAPVWYTLRGTFAEFWSSWWTYAGYMSSSTGRSLLDQIGLGAQKMFGYYQERPAIAFVLVVYIMLLRRRWHGLTTPARTLHTMLVGWLAAGWIELVLAQRYSSHYFSIVAVPTAFIAVAGATLLSNSHSELESTASRRRVDDAPAPATRPNWWPAIVGVCALFAVQGTQLTWSAIEGAGKFRGSAHYVRTRSETRSGSAETRQAVLDLVSSPDDPLLAWTMYPWTYLDNRRVPATRFSWKSFLIGEIYLGRTSTAYVLDRTWQWFSEDLTESNPRIYARPLVTKLEPSTPFKDLVEEEFTTVYTDEDMELGWRRDLWSIAASSKGTGSMVEGPPIGWSVDPTSDVITADASASAWPLDLEPCGRLSTRIIRESASDPAGIVFTFVPQDSSIGPVALNVDFDRSWSSRTDLFGFDSPSEVHATDLSSSKQRQLEIVLLVTPGAAALIVDGRIVSAVLLHGPVSITMQPTADSTTMSIPTVGGLEGFTGC